MSVGLFVLPACVQAATFKASDVLGQTSGSNVSFTSNAQDNGTTTNAGGLYYPFDLALDPVNHRLFVSDDNNNRVLEYNLDSSNHLTHYTADHVLGQPDFVSSSFSSSSSTTMSHPAGITYDPANNRLFVADGGESRVLIFDLSHGITDDMPATNVFGQPDFISNQENQGDTASSTTMNGPYGLTFDPTNDRLFVADDRNSRVLVFDLSHGITDDMPATNVFGQPDFVANQRNQGDTASSTTMSFPYAISYDSVHSRLFIDDDLNYRVLVFNLAGDITDDMPATNVFGQPDFISNLANQGGSVSSRAFTQPEELTYDPTNDRLFVGDDENNRILIFNLSAGINNDMPASSIIGTPDFTSTGAGNASQTEINDPELGIAYDTGDNRLWMTDDLNNRVLAWDLVKITTSSLLDGTKGTSYSQTLAATQSQGTLTWAVTSGSLPTGLSLNSSTGVISGTPTTAGTSDFTVTASDYLSAPQTFTDSASLSITIAQGSSGGGGGSNPPASSGGNGPIFTGPASALHGYVKPRPEIVYPDGHIVYLDQPTPVTGVRATSGLTPSIGQSVSGGLVLTTNHRLGDHGDDILALQQFLNEHGFTVALTGPGSSGQETGFFGAKTYHALIKFQKANGLPATGYLGPLTRKLFSQMQT